MGEPQAEPKLISTTDPLVVPILSLSNFVIGMGAFVVIGMLIPIAEDLEISTAGAGWIMTSYAIAYAILSPLLVALTGQIGRRKVLAMGLGLFALASLAATLAPTQLTLNASRMLAAAGAGLFTPVAAATAAGLSGPERQGRALAAVFFGLTLAQVVGVPAGSFIAYTFGWRSAFMIVVALALPCLYLIWTRIPAGLSFQTVRLRDLGQVLADFPTMLSILFTTSFLGGIYVIYTYLAPLLTETSGYGRNGVTLLLLVFGCGAVVGNLLGGILADKLGPHRSLLGLCGAQVLLSPTFSLLPLSDVATLLLVFLWSSCGWSFLASQQLRLISIAPEKVSVVFALNAAAIYVGAAWGAAIGGMVLSLSGLGMLGLTGGGLMIIAFIHLVVSERLSASKV